jgi:hypothetical protein
VVVDGDGNLPLILLPNSIFPCKTADGEELRRRRWWWCRWWCRRLRLPLLVLRAALVLRELEVDDDDDDEDEELEVEEDEEEDEEETAVRSMGPPLEDDSIVKSTTATICLAQV